MAAISALSKMSVGQLTSAVEASKLSSSSASLFAGSSLPLKRCSHASSCTCGGLTGRHLSVSVRAQASKDADAQNVAAIAQSFATLTATQTPAALAPAPLAPSGPSTPLVFGGLLLAAGGYALGKFTAGKDVVPAVAPIAKAAVVGAVKKVLSRESKKAAPEALKAIEANFPGSVQDEVFIHACAEELFHLGFNQYNCIALVNTCRDEVCRPLAAYIDKEFGLSFNISGLGGLVNCGKTGFKAGFSHSPVFPCDKDGKPRERYVFFAFPHVSVGESGEVGSLLRRGRGKPSSACGALIAIRNDANTGSAVVEDELDAEYVALKKKIFATSICKNCLPGKLSLVDATKAALQVITDDLEYLISQTVDTANADYAVITGVQIHSGNQVPGEPFRVDRTVDYIAPGSMFAVIRGERYALNLKAIPKSSKSLIAA